MSSSSQSKMENVQSRIIHAPTGNQLTCKGWIQEAAYRMIQNNLDPLTRRILKAPVWIDFYRIF